MTSYGLSTLNNFETITNKRGCNSHTMRNNYHLRKDGAPTNYKAIIKNLDSSTSMQVGNGSMATNASEGTIQMEELQF